MNVRFWGVRGSIPAPLTPQQIREKIDIVVRLITAQDVQGEDAKKRFVATLPKWLYGTVGANTACVELTGADGTKIIFDAGSGIRALAKNGVPPEDFHYNLLFSHFHWDHIQGLPFFDFAYAPKAVFDVYSPFKDMEQYLRGQMVQPYYPVPFDAFTKNFRFHDAQPDSDFAVGGLSVRCTQMSHPGTSFSYLVREDGKRFVYATDVELGIRDFDDDPKLGEVFRDADFLIIDSQYTVEEALRKENWGHSAFCYAIDFAAKWHVKKLYLFHHEPTYDDHKLYSIYESAKWYADYITDGAVEVHIAMEGTEFTV